MPFSPRLILPPSSLSMRPAACERSACLSRPANKLVGALQAGAGSDSNNNGGNKDDLYYQRFMGMNEGEPTDDLRVAAEIADMDPSTIDSLRRGTSVDDKMAEAKRAIQEAPTRLTELQVQNLRNGAAINPNPNNPNGQNNNNQNVNNNVNNNSNGQQQQQNQFTFPSFPPLKATWLLFREGATRDKESHDE
eukprot:evm.model.NODE_12196_length_10915_cov_17.454695.3